MFGRCFRVGLRRDDSEAVLYVVAESDPIKAISILRTELPEVDVCFDDRALVTQQLIDALDLKLVSFIELGREDADLSRLEAEAEVIITDALQFAESSPQPERADAFTDVLI